MASVTGMTAEKVNELMNAMVIAVRVETNGQLIYTTRGGEEINAGNLVESDAAVNQAYPVGSLYFATVPTNPATLIGIGTWTRFGKGRTLIGLDETQTEFDAVEEVGGAKTVTLTTQNLPVHSHAIDPHSHELPQHSHSMSASYTEESVSSSGSNTRMDDWAFGSAKTIDRTGTTGLSPAGQTSLEGGPTVTADAGSGQPHANLPPYVVVYIWKRTA